MEVCFILVEPAVGGNIGAAARAIKTMGFKRLRLVNPCEHLSGEAKMFAHASVEILEEAGIYKGLGEALEGIDLSIATTAKKRDARGRYYGPGELPAIIRKKGNMLKSLGVVFGREESGLTNDEIRLCDLASSIPLKQPFPSLNLAQAVMIYAYTLAEQGEGESAEGDSPLRDSEFRIMMQRAERFLTRHEMDRSPALYNRIMERLAGLPEEDVHLALSILAKLE